MPLPARSPLPHRRAGHTTTVTVGGAYLSLTASRSRDGSLSEVLIRWGKHGSATAGMLDAYATGLTLGLRQGVPLADLLRPALGTAFAPGGRTDDPEIPRARSVLDYLARRLAIDWLPYHERARLGVFTAAEHPGQTRLPG